jgi:hypothetical protein
LNHFNNYCGSWVNNWLVHLWITIDNFGESTFYMNF